MALRRDYSLSKDIELNDINDLYSFTNGNYEQKTMPGKYFKSGLKYLVKIYAGICGEDEDLKDIFRKVIEYASTESNGGLSFEYEASMIKGILLSITDYEAFLTEDNDDLGKKIDKWMGAVYGKELTPEDRRQDSEFVGYVELITNRRVSTMALKSIFLSLVQGALPEDECPYEASDENSSFTAFDLPVMTHLPFYGDLEEEQLWSSPFYRVLNNILITDPEFVPKLFHDYNNGNVCVKIWKKNGESFEAKYISVKKGDIFSENITYGEYNIFWIPLLKKALEEAGVPLDDAYEVSHALIGPEDSYDIDSICGNLMEENGNDDENYNRMIESYIMCYFDLYRSFLRTNSMLKEDEERYMHIIYSLKELLFALLCCFYTSTDYAEGAVELLLNKIGEYRTEIVADRRAAEPQCRERMMICVAAEELSKFFLGDSVYHENPRTYFENMFLGKAATALLNSENRKATPEAVKDKILFIQSDSMYAKKLKKMNIFTMKTASIKYAERFLKK